MKASPRTPLFTSILLVIGLYGALEAVLFVVVALWYGFSPPYIGLFLGIQFFFHVILAIFLIVASDFFYNVNTRERLSKVNAANMVTLLRISMLPFMLFLILSSKNFRVAPVLIPTLVITFLTDLVDGRISRGANQVTLIGKILDSVSDYSLLFVVAVAYYSYRLIPHWLFWLITFRLAFQACGMLSVLLVRKKVEPRPTILGKVTVATTMSLFAIEALKLVAPQHFGPYFGYAEIVAGIIVGISIFDKGYFFYKESTTP